MGLLEKQRWISWKKRKMDLLERKMD